MRLISIFEHVGYSWTTGMACGQQSTVTLKNHVRDSVEQSGWKLGIPWTVWFEYLFGKQQWLKLQNSQNHITRSRSCSWYVQRFAMAQDYFQKCNDFSGLQGGLSGQTLDFVDLDLRVPPCCLAAMPIRPDFQLSWKIWAESGITKINEQTNQIKINQTLSLNWWWTTTYIHVTLQTQISFHARWVQ